MDRKQALILTLAVTILLGGIFVIVRSISNKEQKNNFVKKLTSEEEKARADMLSRRIPEAKDKMDTEALGSIESILGNKLKIKEISGATIEVSIEKTTSITVVGIGQKATPVQLSDLRVKDLVKVTYDKISKKAVTIAVERI